MKIKTDHPSLLPPGIHDVALSDLRARFIQPFSDQTQRELILSRFLIFIAKLASLGLKLEIWIDGSFTSRKEDPDDVDIVVFHDPNQLNSLPPDKKVEYANLTDTDQSKIRYLTDVYSAPNDSVEWRSYWRGWYGFDRNEQPKGFARLKL